MLVKTLVKRGIGRGFGHSNRDPSGPSVVPHPLCEHTNFSQCEIGKIQEQVLHGPTESKGQKPLENGTLRIGGDTDGSLRFLRGFFGQGFHGGSYVDGSLCLTSSCQASFSAMVQLVQRGLKFYCSYEKLFRTLDRRA